jgi:hypothetical protein
MKLRPPLAELSEAQAGELLDELRKLGFAMPGYQLMAAASRPARRAGAPGHSPDWRLPASVRRQARFVARTETAAGQSTL